MKKNQKGFTLVELIIAVAILAVVTLAVCGFIVVGSRSYTSANTDIMLQQDAQLALNQISDVIIDTTDSISYGLRSGGSGDMQLVLKDSEFAGEATEKCLVVVNKQESGSVNNNKSYWFYWSKDDETIYFNEVDASSDMDEGDIKSAFEDAAQQDKVYILAQHVQDFSVDISQFEANRVVMLSVLFANGNREYATSNNVTVRNRIALNKITVDPMKRATEFTINAVQSVTLEPGDFFSLADKVTVTSDADNKDLIWEIVGGVQNDTTIVSTSGDLHLGLSETRTNFTVKVSRANEEYAGQNDRVAKTIKVNVKRANKADITGPATAKQGETVDLTGKAVGNLLKQHCDRTECKNTDHIDEDEDLIVAEWTVIEGQAYATILNPTKNSASVEIAANAPEGSKITVQAASQLADRKGYGPVTGTWTITIEKGTSAIRRDSLMKYGTDNETETMTYDFLREGLPSTNGNYVCCVRVRAVDDPNWHSKDDDYYYLYMTGPDMRFGPDIFGLDLTKTYDIYMQALWPNIGKRTGLTQKERDDIFNEYSAHLDSNGKYVNGEFEAGEQYVFRVDPPAIAIKCDDEYYPHEDRSFQEKLYLIGNGKNWLGGIELNKLGTINMRPDSVLNNLRYTLYREDKNGQWNRIYGVKLDSIGTTSPKVGLERVAQINSDNDASTYNGTQRLGPFNIVGAVDAFLRKDGQDDGSQATGKYHIVVGFVYANHPDLGRADYVGGYVAKKIPGDFNTYYYKEWDCTVNFEITDGLTLKLSYEGQDKSKNEYICFPLPSDSDFPFALMSQTKQTIMKSFMKYDKNSLAELGSLDNVTVECVYRSDDNSYDITLTAESIVGTTITTRDYGTYNCKYGGDQWDCRTPGRGIVSTREIVANLYDFSPYGGGGHSAYFPLPTESSFPFDKGSTQLQSIEYSLVWFPNWGGTNIETLRVDCSCDAKNNKYTITIYTTWGNKLGTWTWTNGNKQWNKSE